MLPNEIIRRRRESLGFDPDTLADKVKVSRTNYWDIESTPDEILDATSVINVLRVLKTLNLRPQEVFEEPRNYPILAKATNFGELHQVLKNTLSRSSESVEVFGNRVGWGVEDFLKDPEAGYLWNLSGMCAICAALNVDWIVVLEGQIKNV